MLSSLTLAHLIANDVIISTWEAHVPLCICGVCTQVHSCSSTWDNNTWSLHTSPFMLINMGQQHMECAHKSIHAHQHGITTHEVCTQVHSYYHHGLTIQTARTQVHSFSPLWGNDTWCLHTGSVIHSHHYEVMTHGVWTQVQSFSSSWANNVGCLYIVHVFIHHHELIMQGVCTL